MKPHKTYKVILLFLLVFFSSQQVKSQLFSQLRKINASDREAGDNYGAVSISGTYAIVGSRAEDDDINGANTLSNAGSAYIYEQQSDGSWAEVQKLTANDRESGSKFGNWVDIDGSYAVVGAPFESKDANGTNSIPPHAGAAYIFERQNNGVWLLVQKITANDRKAYQEFGLRVAIDNDYIVIGASGESRDSANLNPIAGAGAAYVFERIGGTWTQVSKIVSPYRAISNALSSGDRFGGDINVSGNYITIGARYDNKNELGVATAKSYAGSVYIYERNANGYWVFTEKLVAPDRASNDLFGEAVSIYGNTLVVGCGSNSSDVNGANLINKAGASYIYDRNSSGSWIFKQKLVAPDRSVGASFGDEIAISGNYILIGAWYDSKDENYGNSLSHAGSAYVYEKNTTSGLWSLLKKIDASDRGVNNLFASTIGLDGNHAIIGALDDNKDEKGGDLLTNAGSAYIFGPLTPLCNTYDTINISECDSLVGISGNKVWYSSGTYNDTIPNAANCDSVVTYHLSIINSSSASFSLTVCDSLISPSGNKTWFATGTYRDTLPNFQGCDSGIVVNLVVNYSYVDDVILTVCDSLISPSGNKVWYSSGLYSDTLSTSTGCDSIFNFDLTINSGAVNTISLQACDSLRSPSGNYLWLSSGKYNDTLVSSVGCDSLITVNLIVNYNSSSLINDTACDSYVSPSGNHTWTNSGVYYDTLSSSSGCDSILAIDLVIENCNPTIKIPQFFSPNGDGANDTWEIENISKYQNNVKIFNRWGALLFNMDDYDNSWNGQVNEKGFVISKGTGFVPSSTYYYLIELKLDEPKIYKGYFFLRK